MKHYNEALRKPRVFLAALRTKTSMGNISRLLFIGALVISSFLVCTQPSGSAAGWSPPLRISSDLNGVLPHMALDAGGNPHVVFHAYVDSTSMIFYTENTGSGWSPPLCVSPGLADNREAKIALDSDGYPHVIWQSGGTLASSGIFYSEYTGTGWSAPVNVSSGSMTGNHHCMLALDPDGNPHAAWSASDGSTYRVCYSENTGGGWSAPLIVSTGSISNNYNPEIAVDSGGNSHVVWEAVSDPAYQVFYATDTGGGWSAPLDLSNSTGNIFDPRLALDAGGDLHVVWSGYGDAVLRIYYCVNTGSGWSAPLNISGDLVNYNYSPKLAVDPGGDPHVVWHNFGSAPYLIYYTENTGAGWSTPQSVSSGTIDETVFPEIALDSGGGPHVVWSDSDGSQNRIYYSEDTGAGWSAPVCLSPAPPRNNFAPQIILDPGDTPHVVWSGYDGLNRAYYSARNVTSVTITASAGTGGSISPSGDVSVAYGTDQAFDITADTGHHISDVLVDGASQGAVSNYTFYGVISAHTIEATFAIDTFTVNAAVDGTGGQVDPVTQGVDWGGTAAIDLVSGPGFHIDTITDNGTPQAVADPYVIGNVTEDHDVVVTFAIDTFTVNAAVDGTGGQVDPVTQSVDWGGTAAIDLVPDPGYHVESVTDNGTPQAVADPYMIGNVTEDHDVVVTFAPDGPATTTWYLAEGCTDGGMQTYLLVQNPGPDPVHIDIAFDTGDGELVLPELQGVVIPALTRSTFNLNSCATTYDIATRVTASGDIVCERAVYGPGSQWATESVGTTTPSDTWLFAEGATAGGMETFVTVQNPGAEPADVALDFLTGAGVVEGPRDSVPAHTRRTYNAGDWTDSYDVSAAVVSDREVVCERAVFGGGGTWAHCSIGADAPAPTWYLAEGCTDGGMQTYILLQNPLPSPVSADVDFMTGAGLVPGPQDLVIPAGSRVTVTVNDYVTDYDVSARVTTDMAIVCERSIYGGEDAWATCSIGVDAPAPTWHLAEGSTAGGMETYILVQNPGPSPVFVDVNFISGSGEVEGPQEMYIPGHTRVTVLANNYLTDYDVSAVVTSQSSPVICERAMYSSAWNWAHASIGYAP